MLEIRGLSAGYGALRVLRDVELDVRPAEIVAVLGSNGAGKSTLNNTISGILRPWAGSIRFEGREMTRQSPSRIVASGIIQVPEGRRIFPNLSVRENLDLGGYRRGRNNRPQNLEKVLSVFPRLAERMEQFAGTLSGGEQQMLALGRALMGEPRLLILDEPSLGLSPRLVEEMFDLIARINRDGLAVMLVEQNVAQTLEMAHRAYVLENGAVTLSGPGKELLGNENLKKSYLGL
ncbi:MAG: ABC transporter ATP-binding protein [Deltaproteobacteria bacterium]|nr:ABC transporter ATP-binding protein [Deltaproteobacteria bacterium]